VAEGVEWHVAQTGVLEGGLVPVRRDQRAVDRLADALAVPTALATASDPGGHDEVRAGCAVLAGHPLEGRDEFGDHLDGAEAPALSRADAVLSLRRPEHDDASAVELDVGRGEGRASEMRIRVPISVSAGGR
jgi:hypothetical protein